MTAIRWTLALVAGVALTGCASDVDIRPVGVSALAPQAAPSQRVAEGRSQLALGNTGLAIESFRRALRDDPSNLDAMAGLAISYERMGRFDIASQQLERALALAPGDEELLGRLAANREAEGRGDLALAIRREMAMRRPTANSGVPTTARVAQAVSLDDRLSSPVLSQAPSTKIAAPSMDAPKLVRLSLGEIALVTKPGPIWEQALAARAAAPLRAHRIELLNAARAERLAARTRIAVQAKGWSNVAIGDAQQVREDSVVLYPPSARFAAARIAAQFGIRAELDPTATHIRVLLGRDRAERG
jgi:hypothetical protein